MLPCTVAKMVYTSLSLFSHVNPFAVALHLSVIAQIRLSLCMFDVFGLGVALQFGLIYVMCVFVVHHKLFLRLTQG